MWDLVYAVGRVALVAIFIKSGAEKLIDPSGISALLASKSFPAPQALSWWTGMEPLAALGRLIGFLEMVLGILVALGWRIRLTAFGLLAFTIVATLVAHNFWGMTGAARRMNEVHFWKNLAIIGGLLMLTASGPGRFAMGRR